MSKYANGKIYKIISDHTDKIYIGSTKEKYLSARLNKHKVNYRHYQNGKYHYVTSFDVIKYDDAKIILLELYPCECKEQLQAKEQQYIETYKDKIVNRNNALGLDYNHKREWTKIYNEKNKEIMIAKRKVYHDANKESRNEKRRTKFTCECGAIITLGGKAGHEKTTTHKMLMQIKDNSNAQ